MIALRNGSVPEVAGAVDGCERIYQEVLAAVP
jgi:hypothetical protein